MFKYQASLEFLSYYTLINKHTVDSPRPWFYLYTWIQLTTIENIWRKTASILNIYRHFFLSILQTIQR